MRQAEASDVRLVSQGLGPEDGADVPNDDPQMRIIATLPRAVQVYEITGAMFFGAAATFRDTMSQLAAKPSLLILRMRGVPAMDSSGLRALRQFLQRSKVQGISVVLSEVQPQPLAALRRAGYSTVTLLARLRGWSTFAPRFTAM